MSDKRYFDQILFSYYYVYFFSANTVTMEKVEKVVG